MITALLVTLTAIGVSALCSGAETGVYSLERVRLQVRAAAGDARARRLMAVIVDPAAGVCTLLVANNITHWLTTVGVGALLARASSDSGEMSRQLIETAVVAPLLFVFGEVVPKQLFMREPARLMTALEPALRAAMWLLSPFVRPLLWMMERLTGTPGPTAAGALYDRGALHVLLTVGDEAQHLTPAQRTLATRVLRLRGTRVRDRMVPAARVVALSATDSAATAVAIGTARRHSRLPVWDTSQRAFTGYVTLADSTDAAEAGRPLAPRPLPRLPADLPVSVALWRLQRAACPIAVVVGPDGSTPVGLISSHDIVGALLDS